MSWGRLEEGELSVLPSDRAGRASSSTVDGGSRMGACVVDLLSLLLTFLWLSLFGRLSLSPLCLPLTLHPSLDPLPHPVSKLPVPRLLRPCLPRNTTTSSSSCSSETRVSESPACSSGLPTTRTPRATSRPSECVSFLSLSLALCSRSSAWDLRSEGIWIGRGVVGRGAGREGGAGRGARIVGGSGEAGHPGIPPQKDSLPTASSLVELSSMDAVD